MISKRGVTFSDFLRGLLLDHDSLPQESVRQGRNSRPSHVTAPNPFPNNGKDVPTYLLVTVTSCIGPDKF